MKKERIEAITSVAKDLAQSEYESSPPNLIGSGDSYRKSYIEDFINREIKNAKDDDNFLWLKGDYCARVFVYSILKIIPELELIEIAKISEEKTMKNLDMGDLFNFDSIQSQNQFKQIKNKSYWTDIHSGLTTLSIPDQNICEALDYLETSWSAKEALLNTINAYFLQSQKGLVKNETYTKNNIANSRKNDFDTFSRVNSSDYDEVSWALKYFFNHIHDKYNQCQLSLYIAKSGIKENMGSKKTHDNLRALLLLWDVDSVSRELFDTSFSRALSQRRHKAKKKDKVPLNTYISPESRAQLKKLAIRKKKTQYEVLEELIYAEFHSKQKR